jgi:peptide chain release factor subunit 1
VTLSKATEKAVEKSVKRDATAPLPPPKITPADIERLVRFDGHGVRVLSAYLDLDPERQATRSYRIVFKDLVTAARDGLDEAARLDLEAEAAKVMGWLEAKQPDGRGLAIFSSLPAGLWQAWFLPVPMPDRLSFGVHPVVVPLLDTIDEHERYVVAVVDKESARLLTVFEGVIESRIAFEDFVPGKHDQGGPAQPRLQRHHETHVIWHVKRVVDRLSRMLRDREFDRLILAGPDEAMAELRPSLPRELERRLVATVPAERFAGDAEILRSTLEVERQEEREDEQRTVGALIDGWRSKGPAVGGIAPTLEALWLRQVWTLVLAEGLSGPGGECPVDGLLRPAEPGDCPACGSTMVPLDDVFDRAAQQAIIQDGRVEIVHGPAADRLRLDGEGLGAILRFRLPRFGLLG